MTATPKLTKAVMVQNARDEIGERFGPVPSLASHLIQDVRNMPGDLWHGPISTVEQARQAANYMAEYGSYPIGMSACETAGINGDADGVCPFAGTDDCTCPA